MVHQTKRKPVYQKTTELPAANPVFAIRDGLLHAPPTSDLSELFHRGQITTVKTNAD